MLKHLKYYLSAQLALTSLAYGDSHNFKNEIASSQKHDDYDELFMWLADAGSSTNQLSVPPTTQKIRSTSVVDRYSFLVEMLYLKPYFQDTSAFTILSNPPLHAGYTAQALNLHASFAFRLGFGFKANWMGAETQLAWMRFYNSTKKTYPKSSYPNNRSRLLVSPWDNSFTEPNGAGYIFSTSAKTSLDFIDLTSKIPLTPLKKLTLSPKIGVRGLVSELKFTIQDIKTAYGTTQDVFTPPQNIATNIIKQKYNGVGLLGGFDSITDLGMGFHFDTIFNAAAVFGNVNTSNLGGFIAPGLETVYNSHSFFSQKNFYAFLPIIDAQFKFGWKKACFNNAVAFDITLGYEIEYMPNFLQFIHSNDSGSYIQPADFSMQGLNLGLTISF